MASFCYTCIIEANRGNTEMASKFFDGEKKLVAHKLRMMVEAVTIAYWGQATPVRFAKAWDNACRVLDNDKATYCKLFDALEWLCEASKDDEKIMRQFS